MRKITKIKMIGIIKIHNIITKNINKTVLVPVAAVAIMIENIVIREVTQVITRIISDLFDFYPIHFILYIILYSL